MKQLNSKTVIQHVISFVFLSLFLLVMVLPIIQVQAQGIIPNENITFEGEATTKKDSGAQHRPGLCIIVPEKFFTGPF